MAFGKFHIRAKIKKGAIWSETHVYGESESLEKHTGLVAKAVETGNRLKDCKLYRVQRQRNTAGIEPAQHASQERL